MSLLKKKNIIIVALVLALICAFVLELNAFVYDTVFDVSGSKASLLEPAVCAMEIVGYEVSENGKYTPNTPDPQVIFTDINQEINSVLITFKNRLTSSVDCQVFFARNNDFNEENSMITKIPFGADAFMLTLPEGGFDDLRLDINGVFTFEDVVVTNGSITQEKTAVQSLDMLRVLATFVLVSFVLLLLIRWVYSKNVRKLSVYEHLFLCFVFCYYFVWAVAKEFDYGPDEAMRYDVTKFLFEHNRLPVGDELLSHWGFSYAHIPTLACNLFGYMLMKFASIYTLDPRMLLIAARMVSVICCTGAVYFVIKLTRVILRTPARWLMIVAIAFVPQFAFLASYVNNDSIALLGVSIIIYAWALGMTDNWNLKNCVLLSVGISTCAISYYNSYGWILLSVFFFIFSYLYKNKKDHKGLLKYIGIIAGLTLLFSGFCFIRHLVIYGDLIGFKTTLYYGDLYAIPSLKAENNPSIAQQGFSLAYMLFDMEWLRITFESFVGVFGYMQYTCPDKVYELMKYFVWVAVIGCAVGGVVKIKKKEKIDILHLCFYICSVICAVITVCLSIYNSYTNDFQPQGRYCYPAIFTIAMFVAIGYNGLLRLVKDPKHKYAMVAMLCTVFIGISYWVFSRIYMPS